MHRRKAHRPLGASRAASFVSHALRQVSKEARLAKAALVSMQDYELLLLNENRAAEIRMWLAESRALAKVIETRPRGPVDVDAVLAASRDDLDQR